MHHKAALRILSQASRSTVLRVIRWAYLSAIFAATNPASANTAHTAANQSPNCVYTVCVEMKLNPVYKVASEFNAVGNGEVARGSYLPSGTRWRR